MRSADVRWVLGSTMIVASLATSTVDANAQSLLQTWRGESGVSQQDDNFGGTVTMVGDIDGDGIPDGVVGAPRGDNSGIEVGEVWVKSGADGSVIYKFAGTIHDGLFGLALGASGDLDGDGVGDFLIGAPDLISSSSGYVYAYSGATGSILYSLGEKRVGDEFGDRVAKLEDIDGDGCADFIVAAEEFDLHNQIAQSGRAYVYSGKTGTQLYTIDGTQAYEYLGASVCGIGDLDGDGLPEIGVGASGWMAGSSGQGTFSIYSGATGSQLVYLEGETANDAFGAQSCRLGDVDRDGIDDFSVMSNHSNNFINEGRVYVYSGATIALLYSFDGGAYNENLGMLPMDGRLDFNHDGYADIAIGDPKYNMSGAAGAAFIYSGRSGRLLHGFHGGWDNGIGEGLGSAVSTAGDIDGDGIDDLIVGAANNSLYKPAAGAVYVYAGNDLFLQSNQTSYLPGDTFTVDIRGGEPYVVDVLVATAVNGAPVFVPITFGWLDQFGEWELSGAVPTGLSGLTLTLMAYAQRSSLGGIVDSSPVTVTFN